jgi:glutamate synthase (NADPH/NADH) small chain
MKSYPVSSESIISHQPRSNEIGEQGLMPGRYGLGIQLLSMAAFTLAFFGWLNESWLYWFENPIWLNRYTEYAIILGFGIWRIAAEESSYTRKRLIVLVAVVTGLWWLIPWLTPFTEPYVGFLWAQPVFPALHTPGTITFLLVLALVFLFGRRVICGWGCPCVGIRETVGFAFRDRTVRSKWAWRLRHSKWFFFIYYVGVMIVTQYPPNSWTVSFVGGFYGIVGLTYFGTFFLAPLVGNRAYCRYLCPFGATFGLLNHAGFYGIDMDREKCNDCRRCEQVCDMGIPVWQQGRESGKITGIEDCMGCGRCVVSCPTDALEFRDVRNLLRKNLVQNGTYLEKRKPLAVVPRVEPEIRPAAERVGDYREIFESSDSAQMMVQIRAQAARCLDCGVPGCSHACPLSNRIPEWLELAAKGEFEAAAAISHNTSNFPEICGRLCPQHRLCEGGCTKNGDGTGAVTIGAAERFITDEAFRRGWKPVVVNRPDSGQQIAVIGAGPAGLACAEQLVRAGCRVTVYDREQKIGGLLATGVPPFKLDKSILTHRHELMAQSGIEFHLGVEVDQALMNQLLLNSDAIFLGMGAQTPRPLEIPGSELYGVTDAISYLAQINSINSGANLGAANTLEGQRVIVLGGGDSAMDCARSAVRQGAARVLLVYRGREGYMTASPKEQKSAMEEGIEFLYERTPVAIAGEQEVMTVRFSLKDGEEEIPCERLIYAFGQVNRPPEWLHSVGIESDDHGRLIIDERGETTHPKVYAGGDSCHGPDLVVSAVAAGRSAAQAIIADLSRVGRVKAKLTTLLPRPVRSSANSAGAMQ